MLSVFLSLVLERFGKLKKNPKTPSLGNDDDVDDDDKVISSLN